MSKLNGKTVLITGGTTGIGLATAQAFHAEGARVFVTGRNPKTLAEARALLPAEVEILEADSSDLADLDRLVGTLRSKVDRLDVLFVNAGIASFSPLEGVEEGHWDGQMDTNLKGPFFLTQKALPLLGKGASVIFTSSVVSQKGFAGTAVYTASKAGLAGLARALATELAPKGIRVNSVAPGPIETPIQAKLGLPEEAREGFRQRVSLGRLGASEEVARAVLFLASEDASFITGEELVVDGGLSVA
ncbi:MAG: SDR family oxidoreductase [Acidobacteria bacterium]|nr:SDR family oxidoreductase [Acidobacteriota bacterium]MBI3486909.1 SDR family oxidoreductase [Acidobacteriota bacterium]